MALLARSRSRSLVAYAAGFLLVGSLAGTAVLLALHSASPFNIRGRALTEAKVIADSAGKGTHAPAVTAPAPAAMARMNDHLSSLVNSGDLPAFNPFTSIEPAMAFVLSAGADESSIYQSPEALLPPIGSFNSGSDTPEYQLARVSHNERYGGGGFGGYDSPGGGPGMTAGGAVSDVGAGSPDRAEYTASAPDSAGPGVSVDDFRARNGSYDGGNSDGSRNAPSNNSGGRSDSPGASGGGSVEVPQPKPTGFVSGGTPLPGATTPTGGSGSGPVSSVPEPSSLLLTGAGLVGLASAMRRRPAR